jgi:hypothetical protein
MSSKRPVLWIETAPDPKQQDPNLMIRHPANPVVREWDGTDASLHPLAYDYVNKLREPMRLSEAVVAGLRKPPLREWRKTTASPPGRLELRWLPIHRRDPRNSFWAERTVGRGRKDRTAILIAGLCLADGSTNEVYFSGLRLRVVCHAADSARQVRFTGMNRSHGEPEAIELEGDAFVLKKQVKEKKETVSGMAFPLDPPSALGAAQMEAVKPSRLSEALQPAQRAVDLCVPTTGNSAELAGDDVMVLASPLIDQPADLGKAKKVAIEKQAGKWHVKETRARTNDFAAISAYYHSNSLFTRMRSYGLDPATYFRCAENKMYVHYRGIVRGSDGNVRNADAVWDVIPDLDNGKLGRILLRFGLADLSNSPRDFPLGLASDVRWNWHEFGHVLLMGSVGEREFRFAHSAGDALAAIVCDPSSELSLPQHESGWRGATFPWATLPRRHDRNPADGWAWDGMLDRPVEGYWKEQILSSTLFRLYRALGGDALDAAAQPDRAAREAASQYVVYLIMRAIQILGAADGVPASSADQFASALIDADIGTSTFVVNGFIRVGGCAHKVVRWAFEQQGLYTGSTWPVTGPGEPEPIDVYVASDLNGGYAARGAVYAIAVNNAVANQPNPVTVTVCNRGASQAGDVAIALWAAKAASAPDWPAAGWGANPVAQRLNVVIPGRAGGGSAGVPVQLQWTPPSPGKYCLLAEVTCEEDRANTRPETGLACALSPTPVLQIVRGDNNLGLLEGVTVS